MKRKRERDAVEEAQVSMDDSAGAISAVVWKLKNDFLQPFGGLMVSEGQGERLSLFKDSREQCDALSKQKNPVSWPIKRRKTGSQRAVEVVVSSQSAGRIDGDTLPSMTFSNYHGLLSRSKDSRSNANEPKSTTERTTRATLLQDVPRDVKF